MQLVVERLADQFTDNEKVGGRKPTSENLRGGDIDP